MYIDTQEQFSATQSAVNGVGDLVSTNVLDTGAPSDDGIGEEMNLAVQINTALASGGAATMQFVLQTSTDNVAWVDAVLSRPFAYNAPEMAAKLFPFITKLPVGLRRYLRVVYRIAGAAVTGGAISANLVRDVQAQQLLPIGYTVG